MQLVANRGSGPLGRFGSKGEICLAWVVPLSSALSASCRPWSWAPGSPRPRRWAATTPPTYVALGDSYAAGDGAGSYLSDGTSCYRSLKGYPGLISASSGYALNLQACSGAVVGDVLNYQMAPLSNASYVTVTIGGNDIGFASTVSTCLGTNTTACLTAITTARSKIATELPAKLDTLFGQVKQAAPGARIVATNYPRLFNGKDCSWLTSFTSAEMTGLNAGADDLSNAIKTAAAKAGIGFADVRGVFTGHEVCSRSPWIRNAQLFSQYESFHPNATGYSSGYKPVVTTALGATATTTTTTVKVKTGGTTSTDTTRGTVKVRG